MVKRASSSSVSLRESVWRERLARFAASEQRVEAFCRREAVSVASFYNWRKRLRDSRGSLLAAPRAAPLSAAPPFIDLGSVEPGPNRTAMPGHPLARPPDDTPTAINIRLDLGGGVVLHIARH